MNTLLSVVEIISKPPAKVTGDTDSPIFKSSSLWELCHRLLQSQGVLHLFEFCYVRGYCLKI